jgi:hypothetical protein
MWRDNLDENDSSTGAVTIGSPVIVTRIVQLGNDFLGCFVSERQSGLCLDCRPYWPFGPALSVKRGAAAIALDIHL